MEFGTWILDGGSHESAQRSFFLWGLNLEWGNSTNSKQSALMMVQLVAFYLTPLMPTCHWRWRLIVALWHIVECNLDFLFLKRTAHCSVSFLLYGYSLKGK